MKKTLSRKTLLIIAAVAFTLEVLTNYTLTGVLATFVPGAFGIVGIICLLVGLTTKVTVKSDKKISKQ